MTQFIVESVLCFLGGVVMGAAIVMSYRVQQRRQRK
jgi:hypothetical protein